MAPHERFPDTPENHPVYVAINRLRLSGLLERIWERGGYASSGPPPRRADVVLSIRDSFLNSMKLWKNANHSSNSKLELPKLPIWRTDRLPPPIRVGYCLPSFRFLKAKFQNDLREYGVNLSEVESWFKEVQIVARRLPLSVAGPFDDVPQGHWASEAVEELRWFGLLRGYPGGMFKGR